MKLFRKSNREDGTATATMEPEAKLEPVSNLLVDVHAELASVQNELDTLQADRSRLEEESRILAVTETPVVIEGAVGGGGDPSVRG